MSLPDALLDEPEGYCEACGRWAEGRLCAECLADVTDLYADEAISEGRR